MSTTSDRGKDFENIVAKLIRLKIDKHALRNKGSHANWQRRSDVYSNLPLHLECKDQETLKPKEWFRQAEEAAFGKIPSVVFRMDNDVMAMIRFDDLLNLFVEIADQKLEIEDLRKPVERVSFNTMGGEVRLLVKDGKPEYEPLQVDDTRFRNLPKFTDGTLKREVKFCKNGHICTPGKTSCMTKGCPFSSTYIKPKAKKEQK
jgi:hypothetical protein